MSRYDESEYLGDSSEEIAQRENEEKMRQVVRSEYRRIQSGKADEDMARDIELEREAQTEARKKPRFRFLRNVITGDFLSRHAQRAVTPAILMSLMFLASIAVILWNLNVGHQRDSLEDEVTLLHDRAIDSREMVYRATSHLSISAQVERRHLGLKDPEKPLKVIE